MKFTVKWLKQYVDYDLSVAALSDRLTMAGLEVDAVVELFREQAGVRVAKVEAVTPHPNADRLTLCDVRVGEELRRVVCGAPNVRAGMTTAIALPGTVLGPEMTIKKSKIRGEVSEGMLCSEKEIGLGEGKGGIMDLAADLACGEELATALDLKDTMVEVDLTPNRPDCASVIGLAREVAGFGGWKLRPPVQGVLPLLDGSGVPFAVAVEAPADCPRYAARLLKGVKIGPSPWWLQRLLLAVGQRPINNVVDITNFVMLEYGQPLHAFDYQRLAGGRIVVRHARAGEKMATLDGVERQLDERMLLICDGEKPVAIAGVMGGSNSEVSAETTEILLESAYFNPVSIRRTSRTLKLNTEASYRFERGIDPQGTATALERAVQLLVEWTGAEVVANGIDCCAAMPVAAPLTLRVQRVNDLLGLACTAEEICGYLRSIEIGAEVVDGNHLRVQPPSFRVDLEREIDLIEEVARLRGYNEMPSTLPIVPMTFSERDPNRELRSQVAGVMIAQGFSEAINYSFVTEKHFDQLGLAADDCRRATVKLLNPLAEDQSVMRTMLLPGLLENVRHNLNRQSHDLRLYEIGKVFWPRVGQELPTEVQYLGAVLGGRRHPGSSPLYFGDVAADFFDIKGAVERVLAELRLPQVQMVASDGAGEPYAERGELLAIQADGRVVGMAGKVAAGVLKQFGIKQAIYFLELDLDALGRLPAAAKAFTPLSKFPAVSWDIALVVPEQVGGGALLAAICGAGVEYVKEAVIFDIYRGEHIAAGMKSVAISITYHADDRTLDDATVTKSHRRLTELLAAEFNGHLREV